MGDLLQDLRHAVRTLRKSPGFITVAMLTPVSLLATYLPPRRATRVDPAIALRAEWNGQLRSEWDGG